MGIISQWLLASVASAQSNIYLNSLNYTTLFSSNKGNIHLGSLNINPLFSISESYDDNIFDAPNNETSDFITVYSPGINLSAPIKIIKSDINVNYIANVLEYTRNSDQSHVDQYFDTTFKTVFPLGLGAIFHERFEDTELPPSFNYIYGELVQRTRRRTNDFSTTITLPQYFARLNPEFYYDNYDIQYDEFKDSSYNEQRIGTRLTYKLLTKINTLTEFNVGQTTYDTDVISDSVFYESLVGVQLKETAKTEGTFKIGYRIRDYKDENFKQFKGVVLSLESTTKLTDITNFSVLLRRSEEEAIFTPDRNFYELNSIFLTLNRKLSSKIDASISNYYQFLNFPAINAGESDIRLFTIGIRPSLNYKIQKWLFANISYWYDNRTSSSDNSVSGDLGRKKNVITFTIGAAF